VSTIHELQQHLWLDTPRGMALAKFLVDHGIDGDNEWICIVNETGEIWSFDNSDVRAAKNITIGRRVDEKPLPKAPSRPPRSMGRLLRKEAMSFLQGLPDATEVTNMTVSLDVEPDDPVEEPE